MSSTTNDYNKQNKNVSYSNKYDYQNNKNYNEKNNRNYSNSEKNNRNNDNNIIKNIKLDDKKDIYDDNIPIEIFNNITDKKEILYILDILYEKINLNNIKYQIVQSLDHLQQIKNSLYYLVPHYQGFNYLVMMIKYNNKNKIYMILKKDLKNDNKMNNIDDIRLYEIKLKEEIVINEDYFDLTIFEAKLNYKKNKWFLIIYDMFYVSNKNILLDNVIDKQNIINDMINNMKEYLYGDLSIKVVTYYNVEDIADLVYIKIKNNDFKINGIIFWPIITGKQYIYINDKEFEKIKNNTDIYANCYGSSIQIENQIININRNLIIQKTNKIDVYEIFDLDKIKRYGIACVPNIKTSHYLDEIFKTNDQVTFECIFNTKFNKWYPIV